MNQEVNVLALVKGKERYVFMYNDKNRAAVLESLARYASDPEMSFSWYDAAVLTQRIRSEQRKSEIAAARAANQAIIRDELAKKTAFKKVGGAVFNDFDD